LFCQQSGKWRKTQGMVDKAVVTGCWLVSGRRLAFGPGLATV
jgi:hypothetical protein